MSSREFCEKSMLFVHMILMHVLPTASVRGMPRLNRHFACRSRTPAMGVLDAAVSLLSEQPASVSATSFFDPQENTRRVGAYADRVKRINTLEDGLEELEDEGLAAKTREPRERLQPAHPSTSSSTRPAVVREAAWRDLELRHMACSSSVRWRCTTGSRRMGTGGARRSPRRRRSTECAERARRDGGDGERLPGAARRRNDGAGVPFLGLSVGCIQECRRRRGVPRTRLT